MVPRLVALGNYLCYEKLLVELDPRVDYNGYNISWIINTETS